MKITCIGLGLIGGSIAKEMRRAGHEVYGVDNNEIHCEKALDFALVDTIVTIDQSIEDTDVFFIAIPVDQIETLAVNLLDKISWKSTVIDAGSTKEKICATLKTHKKRGRFVAAHPLAGTEFSGPSAALFDLFRDKKNIICEEYLSDDDSLEIALKLFETMGMKNLFMNPMDHDKHMAYVSHLSHVSAFMLGQTVLDIEQDEKQIFNLASTGFQSTVRLAKSSPHTWAAIFERNSENVSNALDAYIQYLQEFKKAVDDQDTEKMKTLMSNANHIKRVLKGLELNVVKLS